MGRVAAHGVLLVLAFLAVQAGSAAAASYVPGEVLVRFAPGVDAGGRAELRREHDVRALGGLPVPRLQLVELEPGRSVEATVDMLEREPGVLYAEPNHLYDVVETPDDVRFAQQWGLDNTGQTVGGTSGAADADIDAPEAWDTTTGSPNVTVAVVDTGTAYDHPDLAPNIWTNPGESGGGKETNGLDDDANGFVDDVRGWDFVGNDNDPLDSQSHGTAVAGVVGARGDNAREVSGVNWQVGLMPVRAGTGHGPGSFALAAMVAGFAYAIDNGARVVNASFGGPDFAQSMLDVIQGAPDVLFVAGAGNSATDNDTAPLYPCNYTAANLICVAATDQSDALASFSNFGAQAVDLAAPGVNVLAPSIEQGPPVFTEDFEGDISTTWEQGGTPATWNKTTEDTGANGSWSLTDSPGADYVNDADTFIRPQSPFSLAGKKGCRGAVLTRLKIEPENDRLLVTAANDKVTPVTILRRVASPVPNFTDLTFDMSAFDGDSSVYLTFFLRSNGSVTDDGVHLDDVDVRCLAGSYGAEVIELHDGTSFATPHVTGVAALLWSAEPGLSVAQVKARILSSVDPLPALAGKTVTGGRLNAATALTLPAAVDRDPVADRKPDPSPSPRTNPPQAPPANVPPVAAPLTPLRDSVAPVVELSGPASQRFGAGVVTVVVRCASEACRAAATGTIDVSGPARAAKRYRLTGARAAIARGGRATLRLRLALSARNAVKRALRRRARVRANVTVTVTDAAGNAATKRRAIGLRR